MEISMKIDEWWTRVVTKCEIVRPMNKQRDKCELCNFEGHKLKNTTSSL